MSSENRIWTQARNAAVTAVRINDLQDNYAFCWQISTSALSPTDDWYGTCERYGQNALPNPGPATATLLDASMDWRDRMLWIWWSEVGVTDLPKLAGYQPSDFTTYHNVMYTGNGFDPATAVGTRWDPTAGGNYRLGAADAAAGGIAIGDLCFYNGGAATKAMLWIIASPVVS